MAQGSCLFCKIASRQIPADIVEEAEGLVAFKDINPQAPTHILIIPTTHIATIADMTQAHTTLLGNALHLANRLARNYQLEGYRIVINSGAQAGQSVDHVHLHLLGGRPMRWPPG